MGITFPHDCAFAVIDFIVLYRVAEIRTKGSASMYLVSSPLSSCMGISAFVSVAVKCCIAVSICVSSNGFPKRSTHRGLSADRWKSGHTDRNYLHLAANHFRVLHKVAVHGNAVGIFCKGAAKGSSCWRSVSRFCRKITSVMMILVPLPLNALLGNRTAPIRSQRSAMTCGHGHPFCPMCRWR